jgi:hypothetical protein
VNAYGAYLWNRLNTLVLNTSDELEISVGDNVARLYTQYLYKQIVSGRFSIGPNVLLIGNPESNKLVRNLKACKEFARLKELAGYIRGLPINLTPFIM